MTDENVGLKRICCECVGEDFLAREIRKNGQPGDCSYCGKTLKCIPIDELAEHIEDAFASHYIRTTDYPESWQERILADPESNYMWEREGQPAIEAIEEAAAIPNNAAEDILEILENRHADFDPAAVGEETEFSSGTYYEERGASAANWHEEWHNFEQSLKTEARFFSRPATDLLARVFGHIDILKSKPRRPLVINAGPNHVLTHLYRSRVFQSDVRLEEALCRPDLHLGSPPAPLASAGRMNSRGISVFYGATSAVVALAEVRPPVGSKVAITKFDIIRSLRLLDLTALDNVQDGGSIFDPSLKSRLERVAFLRTLSARITRPVMPDGEAFDYLATQAVADFLATENDPRLDGIVFSSVQARFGRNVVLFHKAARVERLQLPAGTEIDSSAGYTSEDGWEFNYSVTETVPKPKKYVSQKADEGLFSFIMLRHEAKEPDGDLRVAALRVDTNAVDVHVVKWVKVSSTRYGVSRYRNEKRESKF